MIKFCLCVFLGLFSMCKTAVLKSLFSKSGAYIFPGMIYFVLCMGHIFFCLFVCFVIFYWKVGIWKNNYPFQSLKMKEKVKEDHY